MGVIRLQMTKENRESEIRDKANKFGLTLADYVLLHQLHYEDYWIPRRFFVQHAIGLWGNGLGYDLESETTYQNAFETLLNRNLIQIVDQNLISRVQQILECDPGAGPTNGIPEVGRITFTDCGRFIWAALCSLNSNKSLASSDGFIFASGLINHGNSSEIYSLHLCDALKYAKESDMKINSVKTIGQWRTWWWKKFPAGVKVSCTNVG